MQDIQHIGSTSIPGLAAKPILDVMVGVKNLDVITEQQIVILAELKYRYRGEVGVSGRAFFLKDASSPNVHLHITPIDGDYWHEKLLFRDYLRAHTYEALRYEQLKRKLAETFVEDRHSYTANKSDFVQQTVEKARLWKSNSSKR